MFDPQAVQRFRYVDYSFDRSTGTASLHYAFDDTHHFTETFSIPVGDGPTANEAAVDRLVKLLWLAAGISYYKAAVPLLSVIEKHSVTEAELAWLKNLTFHGLGEFSYVNRLSLQNRPTFEAAVEATPPSEYKGERRSVVAVGGGKDSCVSIETVRSMNEPVLLAAIGTARPIVDTIAASGLPSLSLRRTLSPELIRLNGEGALNGHVPVTAVVSLALLVAAAVNDCDAVVMSNERSASYGNLVWDGREVNHQWSKGMEAETGLAGVVREAVGDGLAYFSLLRPLSELDIARRFSRLEQYHPVFTSCNRAFHIDESRRIERWCANCDKCRFVFLILAPFLTPARLREIFGADLLDDASQVDGFEALIGFQAHKPFECVGEVEESVAAFSLIAESPQWRDHYVVKHFAADIAPNVAIPNGLVDRFLTPSNDHAVPAPFLEALHATG